MCAVSARVRRARWDSRPDPQSGFVGRRTRFHVVAETKTRLLQFRNEARKILDLQHHAIPAARFLRLPVRHRPRPRRAGTAQQDLRVAKGDVGKRGEMLMSQLKAQVLRVERGRARHILHLVTNTVNALARTRAVPCSETL